MGSTSSINFTHCIILIISFIICGSVIFIHSNELNILSIGEINANNLGVNVKKTKTSIMICVSILIGVNVSITGPIAFVGLIVPHISRLCIGPNHKILTLFSSIFGSCFLMLTDLLSRTLFSPKELPIGVLTSLIGAIVFVVVFLT